MNNLCILLILYLVPLTSTCQDSVLADTLIAGSYLRKAQQFSDESRYDSMLTYSEKASQAFKWGGFPIRYFDSRIMELKAYAGMRNEGASRRVAVSIIREAREMSENKYIPMTYAILGSLYHQLSNYEGSFAHFDTAFSLFNEYQLDNSFDCTEALVSYGRICALNGHYQRAEEFLQKAESLIASNHWQNRPIEITLKACYGMFYGKTGKDLDKAATYLQESLELALTTYPPESTTILNIRNDLANVYKIQKKYDLALPLFIQNAAINRQKSDWRGLLLSMNNIASMYERRKQYDSTYLYSVECYEISQRLSIKPPFYTNTLAILTFSSIQLGYSSKALHWANLLLNHLCHSHDTLAGSFPDVSHVLLSDYLIDAFYYKTFSLYMLYKETHDTTWLRYAYQGVFETFKVIDKIPFDIREEETQLLVFGSTFRYMELFMQIATSYHQVDENRNQHSTLLTIVEKSKSYILRAAMNRLKIFKFGIFPDSLLVLERDLRQQVQKNGLDVMRWETGGLKSHVDSVSYYGAIHSFFEVKRKQEEVVKGIERNYPDYASLMYYSEIPTADQLQTRLAGKNAALVNYLLTDSMLWIVLLNGKDVISQRIEIDNVFKEALLEFSESLTKLRGERFKNSSILLSRYLIEPIEGYLEDVNKLVIIPSGALWQIPFEALMLPENRIKEGNEVLRYLVERFEISYHFSSTLWYQYFEESKPNIQNMVLFAPGYADNGTVTGLKFASDEVNTIAGMIQSNGLYADVFSGAEVTKDSFLANAQQHQLIHFAGHTVIDEEKPALSQLHFTSDDVGENHDDTPGSLYAAEVYAMSLHTDLLVLSSCESGIGKNISGEGMMSLGRGFFYAGCRNIIYSLWPVFDKQTQELMIRFYEELLNGKTYSSALRAAKVYMLKDPATAAPWNWSGFVLLGN